MLVECWPAARLSMVQRQIGINDLCDKGLVCSLTEFEFLLEILPDLAGSFDLRAGAGGRNEWGMGHQESPMGLWWPEWCT
jgi:hypothetical protein